MAILRSLLAVTFLGRQAFAYTWPNPQMEILDAFRYEQTGATGRLGGLVFGCSTSNDVNGANASRVNSADWLRTAYHDMATHDVTTGTGGLDASIQFSAEQDRPENSGDSFFNTFAFIEIFQQTYVSLADIIALAAITAVEACGGDYIAFRGGRIDAKQAGPAGVPEPQDTLAQHTADFARQGFTPTEMIQLVACGHSLGGVQHTAFPTVAQAPGTANNTSGNEFFDTTFEVFDNKIATDYVSGHSVNPLVVGPNVTTRSDARIFASDGNVTMKALAASNTFFKATCAVLFSRMLNTVPRGVQLTEEVLPLPVLPESFALTRNLNGTLTASTSVRFWNMQEDPSRVVKFVWAGSRGEPLGSFVMSHDPEFDNAAFIPGNITSLFYNLPGASGGQGVFPPSQGQKGLLLSGETTQFWFEVTDDGRKTVFNQNRAGFLLGETSVLVAEGSCQAFGEGVSLFIQIGVVKGANPSSVSVILLNDERPLGNDTVLPAIFNQAASAKNPYIDVWFANITDQNVLNVFDLFKASAEIGGQSVSPSYTNIGKSLLPFCL